jgi:hypothetical protein
MFVVDLETIPFAEPEDRGPIPAPVVEQSPGRGRRSPTIVHGRSGKWIARALTVVLCSLHGLGIWLGMGGREGMVNGWPLWRDDHPLYYHSALVTRSFLKSSWTTAGYDPSFMAGYAKSAVFPASSTLPELVIAVFGQDHPVFAFKMYVLVSTAAAPWLIALAGALLRIPSRGVAIAVLLEVLYLWTDWGLNYAFLGMVPYFLAIPMALTATAAFGRFLTARGAINWLLSASLMSLAFLIHFTTAMIVVPAAAVAYVAEVRRGSRRVAGVAPRASGFSSSSIELAPAPRISARFHLAVWMIPIIVLTVNAFWWLPGVKLASTKGESGFVFSHPEGAMKRFVEIVNSSGVESSAQSVLIAVGLPGLFLVWRRSVSEGWALVGFCGAGIFWGYLAGSSRALDFLQPGRHTYACYTALALAGGVGLDELFRRLRLGPIGVDHLDRWVMAGLVVVGIRMFGYPMAQSLAARLACKLEVEYFELGGLKLIGPARLRWGPGEPFLSSRPSPRLMWVIDRVRRHVHPGERLLYEEGGKTLAGVPDPFQSGRFSGFLPDQAGVEVIGGPYLHAALKTNFTQFGEGMLFGRTDWDRDYFVRYAKLYRPSAILCWTPHSRRFCEENPDLVKVVEDDGSLMIGRVIGFEGDFIEGKGRVEASAGRIRVSDMSPGLDGSVLLRYHSVPYLTTSPPVALESERREDDPVPFIRLRPPAGTSAVELELRVPVGR